jgi:2,3-bisphosphoglycerate-independent phosphoglycerate mutase
MNFHLTKLGCPASKVTQQFLGETKMRVILIVGDGMADRPIKELEFQTPMQAAKPENMDTLASKGISGLLDPVALGTAPGSDAGWLLFLYWR